jgi:hypothetical protein
MRVRVEVTKDDISRGDPGNCLGCPIALALLRCGLRCVVVRDDVIRVGGRECDMPSAASEFVQMFDARADVAPFAFDLDIPEAP